MPVSNEGPDFLLFRVEGFDKLINIKGIRKNMIIMWNIRMIIGCFRIRVELNWVLNWKERVRIIIVDKK